jgi:hypothetical protein
MEEWQNELSAMFKDLTVMFDGFGRELTELVEEITTEAQEVLNLQWDELKEVLTEIWQEVDSELEEHATFNWDLPIPPQPMPDPATHRVCMGCKNYNGSNYGGNLLVCGMHPYGCDSDVCVDWEGDRDLN